MHRRGVESGGIREVLSTPWEVQMGKRMLQREDRTTIRHLFTWIECLATLMVAIWLALALFA